MKVKIYDTEHEVSEEELAKMYERVLNDASEMQFFIRFLRRYAYIATIAGDACRAALVRKLHECLRMYCHYQPLSKIRPILEKEIHAFEGEAMCHHEFIRQQYGPIAQVIE